MWNYRIVRRKNRWKDPETRQERETFSYGIHEAYYDHSGHVGMITHNAIEPWGETIEELRHSWMMMAEAFGQPFLTEENIPEPGYDGAYEIHTDETEEVRLTKEELDTSWKPMTPEERSKYEAEQNQERIEHEQQHDQRFVGVHPLKSLIETIYEDYIARCERSHGDNTEELQENNIPNLSGG